ncbi:hypothetical protein CHGG_00219 [Chaetomium globosum CBS 148.51]|uniref:Reverse transcriptase domain-containing protein n=1 Tax=Chaetomium globosum (strain ATCC 6205 / CBS 148.51 / DSM 1962 / NBRC 6347 / NRRL 1970) TaxID=306901 RepID=Q2HHT5_CHAGB|nr:uncharacterized protein CHGG_00219 [Chaetomium globosum CBS 148.51]EAQ91984.1 hypothetical protein CHGG_00219 [Chaetomium globosum CBS 148.51]
MTARLTEELSQAREQLTQARRELEDTRLQLHAMNQAQEAPLARPAYADVARCTPPTSGPSLASSASRTATPEPAFCTVDMTRVPEEHIEEATPVALRKLIENEMRAPGDQPKWRCLAVTRDRGNINRLRIVGRNEAEVKRIKDIIEAKKAPGAHVLRDLAVPSQTSAQQLYRSAFCAEDHMNRSARIAGSSIHLVMNRTFQVIQLNVRKQGEVHDSLMNDVAIQDAAVIAIQEPQARRIQGRLLTTPMEHHKWTKMIPCTLKEGRWAIRSMLWVNKIVEAEQVAVDSPDITAAVIRLPERVVLVASVYVPCGDGEALKDTCENLRRVVAKAKRGVGTTVDIVVAGDFNCHDQMWGGRRRLILFDIEVPVPTHHDRLLLKNAPWKDIRAKIANTLGDTPAEGTVQQRTDRLMSTVSGAVHSLTPKARPSPYAKRWWTTDLTQLRHIYTHWRNRARSERRAGWTTAEIEELAKGAAKQYHDAIRQQKKKHWAEFLADNDNIWKAAKEQAEELLTRFFPALPDTIDDEGPRPQRAPIMTPILTMEEVERQLFATKSWKAPGEDGLPAVVWKEVWQVVKHHVLALFRASLEDGALPSQWRHANIIPLKKPGKKDYTIAKAWRPISLLATLGKVLESVIAERLSHAVETYGLLPTNHFGARKQRSAEQALVFLQEQIYTAWRGRKIVSLISFDVKGAYNGVCKERLVQRMRARGIPEELCRWTEAFCSDRTASIQVNGHAAERRDLPQAGLPQGSPLSPILFLFFNADLVQRKIDSNGGAIAFVDDFTAWVTGPTAQSTRKGIEAIIDQALDWEKRSGATFEADKTAVIHFTRKAYKANSEPFTIKGQDVQPKDHVKILGVVMDAKLRYKEHIARAASKGLSAAMELKRLSGLSPATARQLFTAMVAPVVDYASSVWMHQCNWKTAPAIHRVQRVAAQGIIGTFSTVATRVAEAEAHIPTAQDRFWKRAIKMWTDIHTLPETNPLRNTTSRMRKFRRSYRSAFFQVADLLKDVPLGLASKPLLPSYKRSGERRGPALRLTERASSKKRQEWGGPDRRKQLPHETTWVGDRRSRPSSRCRCEMAPRNEAFSVTLGSRSEQNPFSGELAAIGYALRLIRNIRYRKIILATSNKAAVMALERPHQQSGQQYLCQAYDAISALRKAGNTISVVWIQAGTKNELLNTAKAKAKEATRQDATPQTQDPAMRSTALRIAWAKRAPPTSLPDKVGRHSKRVDIALPGKHTQLLYDHLSRSEAGVLAQLRTGMAKLNTYLHRIKAAPSDQCTCGQARETVDHFLFRCKQWDQHRREMLQCTDVHRGNLSFYLGGKSPSDDKDWSPNMRAVRATIRFAIATGRLRTEQQQNEAN